MRDTGIGIAAGDAAPRLRPVHPGRPVAGPLAGRAGHRADPGAEPGRDARRDASRPTATGRARAASSSSACPALPHRRPRSRRRADRRPRPGGVPRGRVLVVDDNARRGREPGPAAASCGPRGPRRPRRPGGPGGGRRRSARRWCCWTSACRGWTATRWPGGSATQARPDEVLLVALTGYGQEEDRRRSPEAGFDHHLVKPVDFEVLEACSPGRSGSGSRVGRARSLPEPCGRDQGKLETSTCHASGVVTPGRMPGRPGAFKSSPQGGGPG